MSGAETRWVIVRVAAALAMIPQLLVHPSLWFDRSVPTEPMNVPLFDWLPAAPPHAGAVMWVLMLAALIAVVIGKKARAATSVFAIVYAVTCVFDQARFQPHFTIWAVMLLVVTSRGMTKEQTLQAVRLALASVYFFAGLGKINVMYEYLVHPDMMAALIDRAPFLKPVLDVPWLAPAGEMIVGLLVLFGGRWKHRRIVLVAAMGMHAFIVTMLLMASHDLTVIPFNLGLATCAFAVLSDPESKDVWIPLRELSRRFGGQIAIAYSIVLPLCSLIGFGDSYMSHAYYSGMEPRIRWYASAHASQRLLDMHWRNMEKSILRTPSVPDGAQPIPAGMHEVPVHGQFDAAMGQSLVAEARIADRVKDELCKLVAEEPSDIIVRFYGSANAVTGARMYRDVDCSGSLGFWLRFGGLKTVVLGGSGHLEELAPHGAPTF